MSGVTGPTTPAYALSMSEAERARYRRMAEAAQVNEAALWERAGIVSGARVADVGCGPGAVLRVLADAVGPDGWAHGVEPDSDARAAAGEEIAGVAQARVTAGDGLATGLEPASYDAVMVRHVLFHTGDQPPAIVDHVVGLLCPGGHCYLVDTDFDAVRMVPEDPDLMDEAARYADYQRSRGNDVRIGSRLGHLLLDAGVVDVHRDARYAVIPGAALAAGGPPTAARPQMIAAGVATVADGERWDTARRRWAAMPQATFFVPTFIAIGTRPE